MKRGGAAGRSLLTALHISSSRFKIPDPRKVSLIPLNHIVVRKGIGMCSQQLLLGIPTRKVRVTGHHQEFEMLGIHRDELYILMRGAFTPEDRPNLIDAKHSDIDGCGLILFEPLKEDIVDIATSLVCEGTYYKVDASWQHPFHPMQRLGELPWQGLAGGGLTPERTPSDLPYPLLSVWHPS